MAVNKQTIELHIEELVLHGFSPAQRYQIAAELQLELTRLFTEKGLPQSFNNAVNIQQLNAGSFQLNDTNKKNSAGSQIASLAYDSFLAGNKKNK